MNYYVIGIPRRSEDVAQSQVTATRREAFQLARRWSNEGYSVRVMELNGETGPWACVAEEVWRHIEVIDEDDGYCD